MNPTTESQTFARPERKATLRLGQRHLHLMSLAVILVIVAGLGAGMYQFYINFKITRDLTVADSNLYELNKAIHSYAADWDNKLPDADKWTDQVAGYLSASPGAVGGKMAYLHGEDEHGNPIHYVYNDLVSGYKLEDRITPEERKGTLELSRVVLLMEMPGEGQNEHIHIPPRNTPEGEEALARLLKFPHNAGDPNKATAVVLYANGTTDRITRKDFK